MMENNISAANESVPAGNLRIISYLSPSIPVEYLSLLVQYLEAKLKRHIYLMTECRSGGPLQDRVDPFTNDDADIGIISSGELEGTLQRAKGHVDLLPAAPVFAHPGVMDRPVCFADVIVHRDNKEKYKEFRLLHGSKWAYSQKSSASSYTRPLYELKQMGYNSNFFTKVVETGSHVGSIDAVLNKTVDGAAVNSVVLSMQNIMRPSVRENIVILKSWGPIAVHSLVVSTRLPKELQSQITECLLDLHEDNEWITRFNKFTLTKFLPVSTDSQGEDQQVLKSVEGMRLETAVYY